MPTPVHRWLLVIALLCINVHCLKAQQRIEIDQIDTIKEVVPIWKRENWADGTNEWVHPGMNDEA